MGHKTDRLRRVFGHIRGYNSWMKKVISVNAFSDSETAQYRLKVINYYQRFGMKVAYAQTFKGKHSRNALTVLKTFQSILSISIHTVQTDNGSEFLAEFDGYCQREKLNYLFTYPHSPKINGVVESFNRTIQEDCYFFISKCYN